MANTASQGNFSNRPSSIIARAAAAALLGRLEDEVHGALEVALLAQHLGRAQQHGGMAVMAAGMHAAGILRAVLEIVGLVHRQAVHVGAQADRLQRIALAQGSDQPGLAEAARHLEAPFRELGGDDVGGPVLLVGRARDGRGCRGGWRQSRPGSRANEEEQASGTPVGRPIKRPHLSPKWHDVVSAGCRRRGRHRLRRHAAHAAICLAVARRRTGCEVWVKHENHTPIGAFKVRGGLVYMDQLKRDAAG